jgi:hypothetical protein
MRQTAIIRCRKRVHHYQGQLGRQNRRELEPEGRGKALTVLDDAVSGGRARIRLPLRVIGG